MDARVEECVAALDPILRSTLSALGREPVLRKVLTAYFETVAADSATATGPAYDQIVKQARPILADAGAGKRAAIELFEIWQKKALVPLDGAPASAPAAESTTSTDEASQTLTGADPALIESRVEELLGAVDPTLRSTLQALRNEAPLKTALTAFVQTAGTDVEGAFAVLTKQVRPILADAGSGKRTANELLDKWKDQGSCPLTSSGVEAEVEADANAKQHEEPAPSPPSQPEPEASKAKTLSEKRPAKVSAVKTEKKSKPTDSESATQEATPKTPSNTAAVHLDLSELVDVLPGASTGPKIVATSQASRFAVDASDTASLELDLKDVNLTIAKKEILSGAHLRLKGGVHYVMYGRNGTGKSTLLKAIAERLIPAVPRTLRILLVSQVEHDLLATATSGTEEANSDQLSALATVLMADRERVRLESDSNLLGTALDGSDDAEVARAMATYEVHQAKHALAEAKRHALQRTGARGNEARRELNTAEATLDAAVAQVSALEPSSAKLADELGQRAWHADAAATYTGLITLLEETFDVATAEARASQILLGLGFTLEQITGPYKSLSGGWKARAALASALLKPSDILLLDEPTNYLDLPAVLWLERFLLETSATVVVVSHDRAFVDNVAEEVMILRNLQLTYFEGNLTAYETDLAHRRLATTRQQAALDKKKDAMTKSIAEGYKRAKASGDDKRMKQIKSRQHKLDDRMGLERNTKGHRFKLNRDLAGYHFSSRGGVDTDTVDDEISFSFPNPSELRFPGAMVHVDHATFTYPQSRTPALKEVSLTIGAGERIALVGQNGQGKSTMVKLITGEISADTGRVERHPRARIAVYDQDTIESLSRLSTGKNAPTALSWLGEQVLDEGTAGDPSSTGSGKKSDATHLIRAALARFGLRGRTVDAQPLASLSGGQKVRVGLAAVTWDGPHLLVLDEATQHLDSDSVRALGDALCEFPGAVLLVSHDRAAVKRLMQPEVALADRLKLEGVSEEDPDSTVRQALDEARRVLAAVDAGTATAEQASDPQFRRGKVYSVHQGWMKYLPNGVDTYVRQVAKSLA